MQLLKKRIALVFVICLAPAVVSSNDDDQAAIVWTTVSIGPANAQSQSLPCQNAPTTCPVVAITASGSTQLQEDTSGLVHRVLVGDGCRCRRGSSTSSVPRRPLGGLALRGSSKPGATYVAVLRSQGGGLVVRRRTLLGGLITIQPGRARHQAFLAAIDESGQKVTISLSTDGTGWSVAWTGTITLPESVVAGPVVTSQRPDALATGVFSTLRLEPSSLVPSGWSLANIGTVSSLSKLQVTQGVSAFSHWGSSPAAPDDVAFALQRVTGDAELVVRLLGVSGDAAMAGLMVRASLDVGSPFLWLRANNQGVLSLRRRYAPGTTPLTTALKTTTFPRWLRVARQGNALSVYDSADGQQWTALMTQTIDLPAEAYVGLGLARGASLIGTGAVDGLKLNAQSANLPPSISLISPAPGAMVLEGGTLTLAALAADADDKVESVEFFVDGVRVGTDTAAPYLGSWISKGVGLHRSRRPQEIPTARSPSPVRLR